VLSTVEKNRRADAVIPISIATARQCNTCLSCCRMLGRHSDVSRGP